MKSYSENYKTVFTIFILVFLAAAAFIVACVAILNVGGELPQGITAMVNELAATMKAIREIVLPPLPWDLL